jgi:hypothetical protein
VLSSLRATPAARTPDGPATVARRRPLVPVAAMSDDRDAGTKEDG